MLLLDAQFQDYVLETHFNFECRSHFKLKFRPIIKNKTYCNLRDVVVNRRKRRSVNDFQKNRENFIFYK